MNKPKVSIIIVNYNQRQLTVDCLNSLKKISYPNFETILVDNGSTDDSVEVISQKFPNVRIIKNKKNLGFTGGNNIGFKQADGEFILLLNNDTKVTKNFLEPLINDFKKDKKLGVIQSKLFVMDKPKRLDNVVAYQTTTGFLFHKGYMEKDQKEYKKFLKTFSVKGACMIINRKVLSHGLFDDDFFAYFEETDFCWRVWLMGYTVGFEPKSKIYHKMGLTSSKMDSGFIQFHSFKNRIRTIIKNASMPTLFWMLPINVTLTLAIAVYFLFLGKINAFFNIIKAIIWNVVKLPSTISLRLKIQKTRTKSDKEIFSEVFYNPPISFYFKHLSFYKKSV